MARLLILCLLLAAGAALAPRVEGATDPALADAAFEAGDYARARDAYAASIWEATPTAHPDLLYNLGAAHHRLGEEGLAALAYHRAIAAGGGHPEAEQNLEVITRKNGALALEPTLLAKIATAIPAMAWLCAAALLLWLALFLLLRPLLRRTGRPRGWLRSTLGALCLAGLGLLLLGLYRAHLHEVSGEGVGVVVAPDISARTAPNPAGKPVLALPPGSLLRPLRERGKWTNAALPSDARGWLPADSWQPVVPVGKSVPSSAVE